MTWANRRAFEGLLIAGAVAEYGHLIGLFEARTAVDGQALALAFTLLGPLVTPLLGLAVTRLGSAVAKWAFLILMAVVWLNMVKLGADAWWGQWALALGFLAGTLQTLAASMLFTPTGWRWTARPGAIERPA